MTFSGVDFAPYAMAAALVATWLLFAPANKQVDGCEVYAWRSDDATERLPS